MTAVNKFITNTGSYEEDVCVRTCVYVCGEEYIYMKYQLTFLSSGKRHMDVIFY